MKIIHAKIIKWEIDASVRNKFEASYIIKI